MQILGHAAMANSGFSQADVAKIRAGQQPASAAAQGQHLLKVMEHALCDPADGRGPAEEARIVELLKRGYTDQQVCSHYSLVDARLSERDVARLRARAGHHPGKWVPGVGRMPSAYRV
jgi:hypothetical protein